MAPSAWQKTQDFASIGTKVRIITQIQIRLAPTSALPKKMRSGKFDSGKAPRERLVSKLSPMAARKDGVLCVLLPGGSTDQDLIHRSDGVMSVIGSRLSLGTLTLTRRIGTKSGELHHAMSEPRLWHASHVKLCPTRNFNSVGCAYGHVYFDDADVDDADDDDDDEAEAPQDVNAIKRRAQEALELALLEGW
mmetsp:Transcript_96739/g.166801  ORF Transcript_96739/g.166801 Transcript_96739/m.166801 type:complete len:192 (-) Transcript_96739:90-665(-)